MAEINLDTRGLLNIHDAVRGDDFGPLEIIFKNGDDTLEDLAGAVFECIIRDMQGKVLRTLDNTELVFTEGESKIVISMNEDVTAAFSSVTYTIKQTLGAVISTRLYGTIIFKK